MRRDAVPNTCLMCGQLLPNGCSQSRRYCDECSRARNREFMREHAIEMAERSKAVAAERQGTKDRQYCKKCIYYGSETYGYNLCDYLLKTGKPRGCKPGEGCTMRVLNLKKTGEQKCDRCGATFIGGPKARLCDACRKASHQRHAIHAVAAGGASHGG